LAQCVSNLLSNGAKFISPGTTPCMEISAETVENDLVRVWFKDNGIGIAAEDHHRIFRLFERIHQAEEYEGKLREARAVVYKEQEDTRRRWLEDQTAQVAQSRVSAEAAVKKAKEELAVEAASARDSLAATSSTLADQIATALLTGRAG